MMQLLQASMQGDRFFYYNVWLANYEDNLKHWYVFKKENRDPEKVFKQDEDGEHL